MVRAVRRRFLASGTPQFLSLRSVTTNTCLQNGVFDWKQLEKWKYNEHVPAKCHHKASSSSRGYVCMATGASKMGPCLKKQYSSKGTKERELHDLVQGLNRIEPETFVARGNVVSEYGGKISHGTTAIQLENQRTSAVEGTEGTKGSPSG